MEIIEIEVQADWTADEDLEEFEARFGAHDNVQQHALERIEGAYEEQIAVLVKALRYCLNQTTSPWRVPAAALSIPELCEFILKCVSEKGRKPELVAGTRRRF